MRNPTRPSDVPARGGKKEGKKKGKEMSRRDSLIIRSYRADTKNRGMKINEFSRFSHSRRALRSRSCVRDGLARHNRSASVSFQGKIPSDSFRVSLSAKEDPVPILAKINMRVSIGFPISDDSISRDDTRSLPRESEAIFFPLVPY